MGISDLLKKLRLFDSIFKTEQYFKDKYDIDIKNFNLTVINYGPDIKKTIPDLFGKGKFGFSREDLIPVEAEMVSLARFHRLLIRKMSRYLLPDDLSSLVASATIVQLEDKGLTRKATKLLFELSNRYGERGKRIYNMLRSNIFEGLIYPLLEALEAEYSPPEANAKFTQFFENILDYYPLGIWVNEATSELEIVQGLKNRFDKGVSAVYVYARGQNNINKCITACENFKKEYPKELEIDKDDYKLREQPACTLFVKLKVQQDI